MSNTYQEAWELDEGGFGPSVVEIKAVKFIYDSKWGDNPVAEIYVDRYSNDGVKIVDAEVGNPIRAGVGKGWVVAENGAKVVPADGAKGKFTKQSSFGMFAKSAVDVLSDALTGKGVPSDGATWVGLPRLITDRVNLGKNEMTGKDREVEIVVGIDGISNTGSATDSLDGGVKAQLEKIADEVKSAGGTHDDFLTQVQGIVENDKAARDAAFDDDATSIWGQA